MYIFLFKCTSIIITNLEIIIFCDQMKYLLIKCNESPGSIHSSVSRETTWLCGFFSSDEQEKTAFLF